MRTRLGGRSSTKYPRSVAQPNTEQFPAIRDEFASTLERLRIIRFAQMLVSVLPLQFWHENATRMPGHEKDHVMGM